MYISAWLTYLPIFLLSCWCPNDPNFYMNGNPDTPPLLFREFRLYGNMDPWAENISVAVSPHRYLTHYQRYAVILS